MAARVLGRAKRVTTSSVGGFFSVLNASIDTSIDPRTQNSSVADTTFEVTAGTSVSIRWGGRLNNGTYTAGAANQCAWTLDVLYETGSSTWEAGASDSVTQTGVASTDWTCDRTKTFTPTHTGTVRLRVRARVFVTATNGTVGDINTDGGNFGSPGETIPVGETSTAFYPGLVRCGSALSSLAITGNSTPASYSDALTLTFTTGAAPTVADGTYTLSWRDATPTQFVADTIGTGTSTSLVVNRTVNNTFPAASTAVDLLLTPSNSALSTANGGAALPWVHFTSLPSSPGTVSGTNSSGNAANKVTARFAGAFTADARLSFTHLLQIDDNIFGTPPMSKNDPSNQRLTSEIGFLSARVTNAAGTGINSIAWTTSLQDHAHLQSALTATPTSTTQGGQAGWGDAFLTWTSALPGGQWDKSCTITGPSGATGLESGATATYTLIAANPNLRLVCGGGPASLGDDVKHWSPGMPFEVGLVVFNTATLTTVALDATPTIFLGRLNYATGKVEYLDSDGITWVPATGGTAYAHTLTASPTDANAYLKQFTDVQTAGWGTADVFVIGRCTVGGVPVNDFSKEIVVNGANSHSGYTIDAVQLALSGSLGTR